MNGIVWGVGGKFSSFFQRVCVFGVGLTFQALELLNETLPSVTQFTFSLGAQII